MIPMGNKNYGLHSSSQWKQSLSKHRLKFGWRSVGSSVNIPRTEALMTWYIRSDLRGERHSFIYVGACGFEHSCHTWVSQRSQSDVLAHGSQQTVRAQWIDNFIFSWLNCTKCNSRSCWAGGSSRLGVGESHKLVLMMHISHHFIVQISLVTSVADLSFTGWNSEVVMSVFSWWNRSQSRQRIFLSKE